MSDRIKEKLAILADAAKYDVSCSSSGSNRKNTTKGLGTTGNGICHAYTEDGRCVSLLKILLTNVCIYDCAYCVSRKSNDIKRAAFTVQEIVDLTINFYRRNYIEGLFISSGIFKNADYTMERLVLIAKKLRTEQNFHGYIHIKTIPGASEEIIKEAGLYADRLSINVEMPTEKSLALLAPDKKRIDMIRPMQVLKQAIIQHKEEKKIFRHTPKFAPAGQSTQMVIGATPETDLEILLMANGFYKKMDMRRVYYSGYVPVSSDNRLPAIGTPVPMIRENRLYQADWLMRFYGFAVNEIVDLQNPLLEMDIDPKLSWALRNMHLFPIDINKAPYEMILRIPGVGVQSARKIVAARKYGKVSFEHLKKMGVSINKIIHFVQRGNEYVIKDHQPSQIKHAILSAGKSKYKNNLTPQIAMF